MPTGFVRSTLAAFAVVIGLAPQPGRAADMDIVLTLPAVTLSYAAAWIAEDAGLYKQNGLKVDTRQMVGVAANNAVINGSADFVFGSAATYLNGVAKGQRLLILANMVDRPTAELVMRKDVADALGITAATPFDQRIKAIKGKTFAVAGIGSAPHAWLRLIARKAGLDPENDIVVTPLDTATQLPAMVAKRIDGFSSPPPFSSEAMLKYNAVMIASPVAGDLPDYFPTASVVLIARPETCQKDRDKCVRMTRSIQQAVRMVKEQPDAVWEIIKKHNEKMDPDVLASAWKAASKTFADDMRVTDKMLDVAQKFSVDASLIQPNEVVTDYKGLTTDEFLAK